MASPRRTNRLAHETSPYLLQHAHNPVDWYPWGPEAFDTARRLDKPLFVSIGYATCYWCHVMERQVFENPDIAALMNDLFVNVKVDREERPDVDDLYMIATQLVSGSGGWPMSVFLTPPGAAGNNDPGLEPFFAGTYFPATSSHGRPGFPDVLRQLADVWRNRRADVVEQARSIADAVRRHALDSLQTAANDTAAPSRELVAVAARQLARSYDSEHGGFGGAPKFPQPSQLLFLTRFHPVSGDDAVWQAVTHTLDRMARGGIYDQVGGGFHRYSVDAQWLVPHFEKMLYDNAQLIDAYLYAAAVQPDSPDAPLWRRIVHETAAWVITRMTDATGAFYSAMDAEVDAREGGSYVWTPAQVRAAIADPDLAELAMTLYGLDAGPNFRDPHHPQDEPTNVLHLPVPLRELASRRGSSEAELIEQRRQINGMLLAARDQRKQPITDDKVLASWNGLMIAALADAGRVLHEPRYVDAARAAADAVLTHMAPDSGGLYRTMRAGQAKIPAFLEDYAAVAHGLLALHRAVDAGPYLDAAIRLMNHAERHFLVSIDSAAGSYYDTLDGQSDLFVRGRGFHDGAIPSGNSQMVHNWVTLHELTADRAYLDKAARDLRALGSTMRRNGAAMIHMHHALLRALIRQPDLFETPARSRAASTVIRGEAVKVTIRPSVITFTDQPVTLIVELTIDRGHHINGPTPSLDHLSPTRLTLAGNAPAALGVKYPPTRRARYAHTEESLDIYEGAVTLTATLTLTTSAPIDTLHLLLRYQPCTDLACLRPQQLELPIPVTQ